MERDCGQRCAWGAVLADGAFGCCGACMGESVRRFRARCGQSEDGLREMRIWKFSAHNLAQAARAV